MSYTLVLGGLLALAVLVGGIAMLFWWVRRPATHSRRASSQAPLPLFSHDKAAVWRRRVRKIGNVRETGK